MKSDLRWIVGFALFLAVLTAVPYMIAFGLEDGNWVFTGFLYGVDDGNSYIAKMLSGASGAWTFRTPYTTYPQSGLLFLFLPYLLLGKLAAPPEVHLQLVLLFQSFRFLAAILVVFASYDFISHFEHRIAYRRFGTVLLTTGGGLGWLIVLAGKGEWLGSLPLDFYSPETFGFLAIFGLPHLAAGRALLLWGILEFLKAGTDQDTKQAAGIRVGLFWFFAGIFSPTNPAIAWLIVAVYLAVLGIHRRDEEWLGLVRTAAVGGLVSSPVVLYSLIASLTDPFFRLWTEQNVILSPHPLHYLAAFGLYLPWVILGVKRLLPERKIGGWFPVIWMALLPVLAYLPLNLQRRLPEAIFAAVVVAVVRGLGSREEAADLPMLKSILLLPAFLSTLLIFSGSILSARTVSLPVFRPAAEVRAFAFLETIAEPGSVVLATKDTGNALPAFAPVRVVIGHGPETINFARIHPMVEAYFGLSLDQEEQAELLSEYEVDFVLGPSASTPAPIGAERVYVEDGYVIFRVR